MMSIRSMLAGAVLIGAGAAVVGGFLVVGSPAEARLRRLDERRISDLRQAVIAVNVYWTRTHELPASLAAASKDTTTGPMVDPVTAQPYEYRVLAGGVKEVGNDEDTNVVKEKGKQFELCAAFDRASERGPASAHGDPFWSHTSGRQCFTITAKDLSRDVGR